MAENDNDNAGGNAGGGGGNDNRGGRRDDRNDNRGGRRDDRPVDNTGRLIAEINALRNTLDTERRAAAEARINAEREARERAERQRDEHATAEREANVRVHDLEARVEDLTENRELTVMVRRSSVQRAIVLTVAVFIIPILAYLGYYYVIMTEVVDQTNVTEMDVPLPVAKPVVNAPANATSAPATSVVPPPRTIDDCLGGPDAKPRSRVETCCNNIADRHTRAMCLSGMYALLVPPT